MAFEEAATLGWEIETVIGDSKCDARRRRWPPTRSSLRMASTISSARSARRGPFPRARSPGRGCHPDLWHGDEPERDPERGRQHQGVCVPVVLPGSFQGEVVASLAKSLVPRTRRSCTMSAMTMSRPGRVLQGGLRGQGRDRVGVRGVHQGGLGLSGMWARWQPRTSM